MKKILMYTNDKIYTAKRLTGGIKRFRCLYEGLVRVGYEVDLYCGENKKDLDKYNSLAKSLVIDTKKSKLFPSLIIMLNNFKLLLKLKKNKYDQVIVFDVPTAISLSLIKFSNISLFLRQDLIEYRKVILDQRKVNKLYKYFYIKFMNFCEYICLKNANKIIVQCDYDLNNLLIRHNSIRKSIIKKSFVQINNINPTWIVEKSKVQITKIIDSSNFKIGFIGDFSNPRKGHDILLSSLKNILDNGKKIDAYLIGDGGNLDFYKNSFKEYHGIHFLGRLKNPIEILKQMDLLVVPSLADSCPNTVLEALYNDVLVIGSNRGGIPEILKNSKFLFEIDSLKLEKKINEIMNSKSLRNKMLKEQNVRKQELLFNWENKIIEILEDYNEC